MTNRICRQAFGRAPTAQSEPQRPAVFSVLGVRVNAVQIPNAIEQMELWTSEADTCHFIAVTGMHGVTEAQHQPVLGAQALLDCVGI